ncbi:MAG: restriction endonuclease [Chitinophagaceae bacterium]|nr:restriction endonuclease [Chitinophagaceae bacterium]
MNAISITKASGEIVPFSEEKLKHSLQRSGATPSEIDITITKVKNKLVEGLSTKKIYDLAYAELKKFKKSEAARYHLKKAIMHLGPSGFPFERFIGELMAGEGYTIQVGTILQGICVSHEIDVIAEKENRYALMECKYHNQQGIFCDVKVPLYIRSRTNDVIASLKKNKSHQDLDFEAWVVTNTKFSNDARQYGLCAGMKLMSWDYPVGKSIKDRVDLTGLYPLTCLTTLTKYEKQKLLDLGVVLCRDLISHQDWLRNIDLKPNRLGQVLKECEELCLSIPSPTHS